jgi:hypothetical protein
MPAAPARERLDYNARHAAGHDTRARQGDRMRAQPQRRGGGLRILFRLLKWGLIGVVFVAAFLLVSAPFYIYGRFNADRPIAEIAFKPLGPKRYQATLATGDLCTLQTYEILGDQWQLDASFIKWKGLGTLLGLQSLYRLDRLSGRYADVEEQNVMEKRWHALSPRVLVDVFPAEAGKGLRGMLVDTRYGSSVYLDIDTTRRYRVYATEDALIARVVEPVPGEPAEDELTVVIDKACGQEPGLLEKLSRRINDAVFQFL